jgi:alkylation response protein AidB-like acyl-CoA dehydrogenase
MRAFNASLAKALANGCYELVSNEAVQMHGGMGTTDEFDIGLFLKRARVSMQMVPSTAPAMQNCAASEAARIPSRN